MTTTQRLRVEACRASVLALHAAAGLAGGPDADRQLLRVLRSAEALARTAVALALALPKTAAPPGDDAAPCAGGSRRRKRRSKKNKVTENDVMVGSAKQTGEVSPQPAPQPLNPEATVFVPSAGRVLKAQSSRERSPHRAIPSASISNAPEVHTAGSGFAVDDIVIITGLQSRPELVNSRCRILGFDADGGRYRVSVEGTGENVRIKPEKLQHCLRPEGFVAVSAGT